MSCQIQEKYSASSRHAERERQERWPWGTPFAGRASSGETPTRGQAGSYAAGTGESNTPYLGAARPPGDRNVPSKTAPKGGR